MQNHQRQSRDAWDIVNSHDRTSRRIATARFEFCTCCLGVWLSVIHSIYASEPGAPEADSVFHLEEYLS